MLKSAPRTAWGHSDMIMMMMMTMTIYQQGTTTTTYKEQQERGQIGIHKDALS